MTAPVHVPVMTGRVVDLLAPALAAPGATLLDATLGLGGHAAAVLQHCPQAHVVGLDRDPEALAVAADRLAAHGDRVRTVRAVFDEIQAVLADLGVAEVDGVLFDLGVSSMQLDRPGRGFAYRADAPLDMRMDTTTGPTAAQILNDYSAEELARVLREHGDERFAARIARAVVRERERAPFTTSARLVQLLYDTIPAPARRRGGHPAKRTFQALRMEVNDEPGALRRALPQALAALRPGGRLVVEAYHSGEDRIVKRALAGATRSTVPEDLPVVPPGYEPEFRALVRGAQRPGPEEIEQNPRAAPVRLRAVERTRQER